MIALFTSIYLIGAIVMGGFILFGAMMGAMFGTIEFKAIFIAVFYAAIWPLAILYGLGYGLYHKFVVVPARIRQYAEEKELKRLHSLPNYRKMVVIKSSEDSERVYYARVREWTEGDKAILWCVEGPNPDGYTDNFAWPKSDLEFVEC